MKQIPKNIRILIGGVLIVVIAFLAIRYGSRPKETQEQTPIEIPKEEVSAPVYKPTKATSNEVSTPSLPYGEAVVKYKNSRIQFDQGCQAIPANQSFKVGTDIMLDNRSPKPATISIGSKVYLVEAYGYQVVDLSTEGLFMANCNGQKNVLTLSVQK